MEGNERVRDFFPGTIAELDRLNDPQWTESVTERVVAGACR